MRCVFSGNADRGDSVGVQKTCIIVGINGPLGGGHWFEAAVQLPWFVIKFHNFGSFFIIIKNVQNCCLVCLFSSTLSQNAYPGLRALGQILKGVPACLPVVRPQIPKNGISGHFFGHVPPGGVRLDVVECLFGQVQ